MPLERVGELNRGATAFSFDSARPVAGCIETVTVIGGGQMGRGIALALLGAGLRTHLIEPVAEARDNAVAAIAATISRYVDKGRMTEAEASARTARLFAHAAIEDSADAQLFIEAAFEDIDVKRAVFTALDRIAAPDAILASNTSSLDLNIIAAFTGRPENVVGMHFFNPAHVMRLLEVVRGARTSDETVARAMSFASGIGKVGVVAGVCDGFIGNRIFEEYLRQAYFLIEEGALPQDVDRAMEAFGMAMGPFRTMDLAGQDIGWSIRKRRKKEQPDRPYSAIPDRVCELGRFGQKTGAGFYLYADGRTPTVDSDIDSLVLAESARLGLARRAISDDEIVSRCVLATINEGSFVLGEAIAETPADIDTVFREGYGFPASRGGPMAYADSVGLPEILTRIQGYAVGRNGWSWTPAPLIEKLAADGATFGSRNR